MSDTIGSFNFWSIELHLTDIRRQSESYDVHLESISIYIIIQRKESLEREKPEGKKRKTFSVEEPWYRSPWHFTIKF